MVFKGENLKEISFPLGGIGSGCIGLSGNGMLIDWEIFNHPNKKSYNNNSHIAVRAFNSENQILDARVLAGDAINNYIGSGCGMETATMNGMPHFEENTFNGEFPIAELDFFDKSFPGKVKLVAFNPYIPLDSRNSSIPAAFFEIEFENNTDKNIRYEAVFSVRNPFPSTVNKCLENQKGIIMYDANNNDNNLSVMTDCENSHLTDYWYRGWFYSFFKDNLRGFWSELSSGADLKCRNYSEPGRGDICSVSASVDVKKGEKKRVRFILSWSIPVCWNYWFPLKDDAGNDVTWRNYYATIFENSEHSGKYSLSNWDYLYDATNEFRKALYTSTIDESIKSAIGSGLSVLKSPTVMRLEDGSLYGFEGSGDTVGSCEGLCQHVWNYAYVCCYLFPDLEMSIRDNEFKYGVLEDGETVIRLPLPFDRKEFSNLYTNDGTKFRPCVDGQFGDVIKTYREWKLSGDNNWLKEKWASVKKVLEYAWSKDNYQCWDEDCDGVLDGRLHHTLDIELFGPNAWLEGFYLTALKAAAEMAEYLGEKESAEKYRKLFENGYEYTKKYLFNGEYFIQQVDLKNKAVAEKYDCCDIFWNEESGELAHQISDGCLIDQLCGQWHASLCGIGDVFDKDQARSAAINIYKNNFKTSMRDIVNPWRLFAVNDEGGTIICSYSKNAKKPMNPIPYCEEVMSGFEYAFAGVLMQNGYINEAINVVREVRKRYDGAKRNPWNDTECGHNYVRSMSAYALIPILSGFVADLPQKKIKFNPITSKEHFKSIWSVATGWGTFELKQGNAVIKLNKGKLLLKELSLPFAHKVENILIDSKEVSFCFDNGSVYIDETIITKEIQVFYI